MSEVREMDTRTLVTFEGSFCSDPKPGDLVRFYLDSHSSGTVIKKIDEDQCEVLWSNLKNITPMPAMGNRNYSDIGKKLFPVEPMPQGALPLYLDHQFNEQKINL